MIFDAKVEVVCDNDDCGVNTYVDLPAGARGTYLFDERAIERHLTDDGWKVIDGKHFCDNDECLEVAVNLEMEQ